MNSEKTSGKNFMPWVPAGVLEHVGDEFVAISATAWARPGTTARAEEAQIRKPAARMTVTTMNRAELVKS